MSGNVYTLRARCATWDAVEGFYLHSVMPGGLLAARVPFVPKPGDRVTLALELPDEVVMAIDGVVRKVAGTEGGKTPIVVRLVGFGDKAVARLAAMVAEARAESEPVPVPASRARSRKVRPPPPRPEDAPVNIRIDPLGDPDPSTLDGESRAVYERLIAELERIRELDAAAVIGCDADAELEEVRAAYVERVRELHPDVLARHRSPVIAHAAQELFIFVNRAYDRLRSAARAAGRPSVTGSAIRKEMGWVVDVSDFGEAAISEAPGRARRLSETDLFRDVDETSPRAAVPLDGGDSAAAAARGSGDPPSNLSDLIAEAAAAAERGDFGRAAELYAEALGHDPRDRKLRARYHATVGRQLIGKGDRVRATTQLELALSHDPDNAAAAEALGDLRGDGRRRRGRLSRWFGGPKS